MFGRLIQPTERRRATVPAGLPALGPRAARRTGGPAGDDPWRRVHDDKPRAAELRAREAGEVAAAVRRVLEEGWQVDRLPDGGRPTGAPPEPGDITILVPTRTSLPALEDALSAAGIAYRAESASLVYASRLIRDLLLTLRAVDDPTDELASWPPCARRCSPAATTTCSATGASSTAASTPPAAARRPAAGRRGGRGPRLPPRLHDARLWLSPSELVDRIVADRRVLELGEAEGRPATCGGGCASCSTRPGPGPRPPTARSASTSRGSASRPPRAPAWPRPSCRRPTTTPCGS